MRDPKRIPEVLNQLKALWSSYPDLRLGQLILNIVRDPLLYYIEDDELIKTLRKGYSEVDYIENNKPNIQNSE
jgi:uncharacterized protein YihD (DUF1040 family)